MDGERPRKLPGIAHADCGDYALAYLAGSIKGEGPEDFRKIRKERFNLKRMDGTPDKVMLKLLRERGFEIQKITPAVVQTARRVMLQPINDRHVVLFSAQSTLGEQSWFVQWGGLVFHNLEALRATRTLQFNWKTTSQYLVKHPTWKKHREPGMYETIMHLIRTAKADRMLREGRFDGIAGHIDLEQFELPTDPDELVEMLETEYEEQETSRKKSKEELRKAINSVVGEEPEEEFEEDDEEA